jgi:hypothetical protein
MARTGTRGLVGRLLIFAAALLSGIAALVYAGALPVERDVRARLALVVGGVAASDAAIAFLLILLDRP